MNRIEQLLTILIEEAAEVQQATTKILRFGLEEGRDISAREYGNNVERLRHEINHVRAMIKMLEKEGIDLHINVDTMNRKRDTVEKYLLYSKECGTME